ncbi:MAG: hypothetical protein IJU32_02325, partial [Pyramidobacter sp.]|nr:hypothetical protein [Pyramidobacter sp.]
MTTEKQNVLQRTFMFILRAFVSSCLCVGFELKIEFAEMKKEERIARPSSERPAAYQSRPTYAP